MIAINKSALPTPPPKCKRLCAFVTLQLVGYGYDKATHKSEFHILDAQNFEAKAVARVLLPVRVPYGLHGTWLPGIV